MDAVANTVNRPVVIENVGDTTILDSVDVTGILVVVVLDPLAPTVVVEVAVAVDVKVAFAVVVNPSTVVQTLTLHSLTMIGDPGVMTITGAKLMPV